MILKGHSAEMAAWAGRRLGTSFQPPFTAWGITDRTGAIVGAVVFNDYDARNIEVTVIGPGAFRKDTIREIGRHCFDDLNCKRVSLTTRASNDLVRSLIERMGGELEGRKRDYYDDDDAVIYGVLKTDFKYRR